MKKTAAVAGAASVLLLGSLMIGCVVHEVNGPLPPDPSTPASSPTPAAAAAPAAPAPAAPAAPATPATPSKPATPAAPSTPAAKAVSEKHPYYIHALSDLREARANLERKGGDREMKWDEHEAVAQIDRAIHDIKEAAIDDGKNIEDHLPVDAKEPRVGRLHKALAALRQARTDVDKEEDNAFASGLRGRAIKYIEDAIHTTEVGIQAAAQAS